MKLIKGYEAVIGLEIHIELATRSKLFCRCSTAFGGEPNTRCCPVCMGMPGALPLINAKAVEYAVISGLLTHCSISDVSHTDRKNYFYPDLPKGYQISQNNVPLCYGGYLDIANSDGMTKRIGITRIHIEEDAGKLTHSPDGETLVDLNRSGIPLIEVVTEPDIRTLEEAEAFLRSLKSTITLAGIAECKMNEGGMRCDVNLSVRKQGDARLGTRTEIKNINSFAFVRKAIEYEYERQVAELEKSGAIIRETRRFDADDGKTYSMRSKENAADYRFLVEPDIPPIDVSSLLERYSRGEIKFREPLEVVHQLTQELGVAEANAYVLISDRSVLEFFESCAQITKYPKQAADVLINGLKPLLPPDVESVPFKPEHLAEVADMLGDGIINSSVAKTALKASLDTGISPRSFVETTGAFQVTDVKALEQLALEAMSKMPQAVEDYKKGKKAAIGAVIGLCMKKSGGRADAELLRKIIEEILA